MTEQERVTVTIAEFAEAIRKNGLPQQTGSLFQLVIDGVREGGVNAIEYFNSGKRDYKVVEACAFGIGLINIGARYEDEDTDEFPADNELATKLFGWTWDRNDNGRWTLDQIADEMVVKFNPEDKVSFPAFDWKPFLPDTFEVKE